MTQKVRRVALFETLPRDCLAEILFFFGTPKAWVAIQGTCKQLYNDLHHPETAWGMENAEFHLTTQDVHLHLRTFVSDKRQFVRNIHISHEVMSMPPPEDGEDPEDAVKREEILKAALVTHNRIFEETLFFLLWQCPIKSLHLEGGELQLADQNSPLIEALCLPSCKIKELSIFSQMRVESVVNILTKLPELRSLSLFRVTRIGPVLEVLRKFTTLSEFDADVSTITPDELCLIPKVLPPCLTKFRLGISAVIAGTQHTQPSAYPQNISEMIMGMIKTYKSLSSLWVACPTASQYVSELFAAELKKNKSLKEFGMCVPMDSDSLATLMRVIAVHETITHLELSSILLFDDDVEEIANALIKNTKLVGLTLHKCTPANENFDKIAEALSGKSKLQELCLYACDLSGRGVWKIASAAMTNGTVRILGITGTGIGDHEALKIADLLNSQTCVLQALGLSKSRDVTLGGVGKLLCEAMKDENLRFLDLSKCNRGNLNYIGLATLNCIRRDLLKNSTLRELDLRKTFREDVTTEELRKTLKEKAKTSDFTFYL